MDLKFTNDGSHTLYLPEMDEQYHSMNGAITESNHVYINCGFRFHPSPAPVILEVGFGTGLNCLLTAAISRKDSRPTYYIALENHPLSSGIITQLNYGSYIREDGNELFKKIHQCPWDEPTEILPTFTLLKIQSDFTVGKWTIPIGCDIIYFDAFGPDKQPDMWLPQHFAKICEQTRPGGIIVTYSAKGEVRRRMEAAGFRMERIPGPPGKKEMLRGIKLEANPILQKK